MKKFLLPVVLICISLLAVWSVATPGLFRVHDYTHAARIAEMARGLADGQLPVRWSANFGYGFGMPLFLFYAPLPYVFGALLWLLGLGNEWSVKALFLIPTVITVIAGYLLARRWLSQSGALLAAMAITLAPYRALNLFVRGAVSESWGMAFFVLSLFSLTLAFDKKRYGWLALALSLAGIVLSHNLTMLMAALPLAGFTAILIFERAMKQKPSIWTNVKQQLRELVPLVGSVALALGLSAFYWLPALVEKPASQLDTYILSDYFNFRLHFLYVRQFFNPAWGYGGSSWGPVDDISFFLGFGQIAGLLGSMLAGLLTIYSIFVNKRQQKNHDILVFWLVGALIGVLGLATIWLSLERSLFVWTTLDFLKYLQFPWRFLAVATPLLALVSVWWSKKLSGTRWYWVVWPAMCLLLLLNLQYFQPEHRLNPEEKLYSTEEQDIQGWLSGILIDYVPTGFTKPSSDIQNFTSPSSAYCSRDCTVTLLHYDSKSSLYTIVASTDTTLILHRSFFPGWQAEINGKPVDIKTGANDEITVSVPAGESQVGVYYSGTTSTTIGDAIFVLSVVLILIVVVRQQKTKS